MEPIIDFSHLIKVAAANKLKSRHDSEKNLVYILWQILFSTLSRSYNLSF